MGITFFLITEKKNEKIINKLSGNYLFFLQFFQSFKPYHYFLERMKKR